MKRIQNITLLTIVVSTTRSIFFVFVASALLLPTYYTLELELPIVTEPSRLGLHACLACLGPWDRTWRDSNSGFSPKSNTWPKYCIVQITRPRGCATRLAKGARDSNSFTYYTSWGAGVPNAVAHQGQDLAAGGTCTPEWEYLVIVNLYGNFTHPTYTRAPLYEYACIYPPHTTWIVHSELLHHVHSDIMIHTPRLAIDARSRVRLTCIISRFKHMLLYTRHLGIYVATQESVLQGCTSQEGPATFSGSSW